MTTRRLSLLLLTTFTVTTLAMQPAMAEMRFQMNDAQMGIGRLSCEKGEIQLETLCGRIKIPIRDLVTLSADATGTNYTCFLTNGDHWQGELVRAKVHSDDEEDITLEGGELRSIVRSDSAHKTTYIHQRTRVRLTDGSKIYLEDDDLSLHVYNYLKKRVEIPLGCLRAAHFLPDSEGDISTVLMEMPNGEVYRCNLAERTTALRTVDTRGNRLRIDFADIAGIMSVHDTTPRPQRPTRTMRLKQRDEPMQRLPLPFEPWIFEHEAGRITVLPHALRGWSAIRDDSRAATVVTQHGDVLQAKPRFSSINTQTSGEQVSISAREVERITTDTPPSTIPDAWFVLALKSRSLLVVQLDDQDPLIKTLAAAGLTPAKLTEIATTSQMQTLRLRTTLATDVDLECETKSVSLVQLTDGARIRVPWSRIAFLRRSQTTGLELAQEAADWTPVEIEPAATPPRRPASRKPFTAASGDDDKADDSNRPDEEPEEPEAETVTIKVAGLGTVELLLSTISAVVDDNHSTCIETTSGSHYLTRRLSKSRIEKLTSHAPRTEAKAMHVTPEGGSLSEGIPASQELQVSGFRSSKLSPAPHSPINHQLHPALRGASTINSPFTLRLTAGTILRGDIAEFDLTAEADDLEELTPAEITSITSDAGGHLLKTSAQRTIRLKRRSRLKLALAASEDEIWLKLAHLELLTRSAVLPPPSTPLASACPIVLGMVAIPGGSFQLGSNTKASPANERPQQRISLSPFWMDECEVTRAQFARFVEATDHITVAESSGAAYSWDSPGFPQSDDSPVVAISWFDAAEYCNWRSKQSGLNPCYEATNQGVESDLSKNGFRLPTEAEWEYAARSGGKVATYAWGSSSIAHQQANYRQAKHHSSDGWEWTSPTKHFPPNSLGLYDMSGNVWEWCHDIYNERAYATFASTGTKDPVIDNSNARGNNRVMRGGSFKNDLDLLRTSARGHGLPYASSPRVGFRCVRRP